MERRNWTLESLNELIYVDSLDKYEKADALVVWVTKYTSSDSKNQIPIELNDFQPTLNSKKLKLFLELFYKNIKFIKDYKDEINSQINSISKIKAFVT